jgi:Tfp pilus assembly protein PilF
MGGASTILRSPVEGKPIIATPTREAGERLRQNRTLVLTLLLVASACTSYSNPERADTQVAFGTHVAKQGLWREAAFRYEQAIAKDPANARAHNNLAVAMEANGDFSRALAEYKKALELDPNNNYIRRNYARFAEFYTSYTKTTGKAASAP